VSAIFISRTVIRAASASARSSLDEGPASSQKARTTHNVAATLTAIAVRVRKPSRLTAWACNPETASLAALRRQAGRPQRGGSFEAPAVSTPGAADSLSAARSADGASVPAETAAGAVS
jgi:hypothetical protein